MKRLVLFILLIAVCRPALAQSWQDTANIISHFFNRYKPGNPGCQLAISRNGKVIFSKAWGLADIERNVPYTTETVTEPGSISKQFTAACILLLEQQGKLSLSDDVRKYIPELPNYGYTIRLKNLLHHTSGLREWSELATITGWPRTTKAYTNLDVLHMLCRQQRLNNIPGTEYIYSNSNYVLLALVVERVSGMSLPDFTKQYIFIPAGMTHTGWRDNFKKIVPNRGLAYIKKDKVYRLNMPNENVYGPGGLLTTTGDLLKWADFYLGGKLGGPGLLAKQLAVEPLPGGAESHYAAGLFIGKFKGYDMISHDGQTAGYVGIVQNLPALKLSIAWLSNVAEFRDSLFAGVKAIDNLLVKSPMAGMPAKAPAVVTLAAAKTKKYAGWYRNTKTDRGANIGIERDTLWLGGSPLVPVDKTTFHYLQSTVSFNKGGFIYTTGGKVTTSFTRESPAIINTHYLKAFTGTFYSKETESSFRIIFKDGKLMLEQNYLQHVVLQPTYTNAFDLFLNVDSEMSPVQTYMLFKKSGKEGALSCEVSMNDARKIKFVKVRS